MLVDYGWDFFDIVVVEEIFLRISIRLLKPKSLTLLGR